jgi:hypothetical protein
MLKYTIKNYATPYLRDKIIEALNISPKSYYNKVNATINDNYGFEGLELLKISKILNRPAESLITPEAKEQILNS